MAARLVVHAVNVMGGGGTLLRAILNERGEGLSIFASVDSRFVLTDNLPPHVALQRINPTIPSRLLAEWRLSNLAGIGDRVLCFGNLPPIFRQRARVSVFVQNRYVIDPVSLSGFTFRVKLRIAIERLWLKMFIGHVDEFIVQTNIMRDLLGGISKNRVPIVVIPLVVNVPSEEKRESLPPAVSEQARADFVYVASGDPHKNHKLLIEAWRLLAADGLFPRLQLTVSESRFSPLCMWMEEMRMRFGLNISNLGEIGRLRLEEVYRQAAALIYPSLLESFGLPLIEATQAGLPVVAAELDYVREMCNPVETFDPRSALSIARAVKRFMGVKSDMAHFKSTGEFLSYFGMKPEKKFPA